MCLCETKYHGGRIAPFWGSATLPEKVARDMGYRSDSIVILRDMGPLRPLTRSTCFIISSVSWIVPLHVKHFDPLAGFEQIFIFGPYKSETF